MSSRNPSNRLRQAVQENNLSLVQRLRYKTELRNTDTNRLTSLAWAALSASEEVFEWLLLDAGHDDEELSRDADNSTILHMLASLPSPLTPSGKKRDEVQKAAVNMTNMYSDAFPYLLDWSNTGGKTALHIAAQSGNDELVKTLCDLGADFNLTDLQGNTPLHYASAWNNLPIILTLLHLPDLQFSLRNNAGFTAIDYAYSVGLQKEFQVAVKEVWEARKMRKASAVGLGTNGNGVGAVDRDSRPSLAGERDELVGLGYAIPQANSPQIQHPTPQPAPTPLPPVPQRQGSTFSQASIPGTPPPTSSTHTTPHLAYLTKSPSSIRSAAPSIRSYDDRDSDKSPAIVTSPGPPPAKPASPKTIQHSAATSLMLGRAPSGTEIPPLKPPPRQSSSSATSVRSLAMGSKAGSVRGGSLKDGKTSHSKMNPEESRKATVPPPPPPHSQMSLGPPISIHHRGSVVSTISGSGSATSSVVSFNSAMSSLPAPPSRPPKDTRRTESPLRSSVDEGVGGGIKREKGSPVAPTKAGKTGLGK